VLIFQADGLVSTNAHVVEKERNRVFVGSKMDVGWWGQGGGPDSLTDLALSPDGPGTGRWPPWAMPTGPSSRIGRLLFGQNPFGLDNTRGHDGTLATWSRHVSSWDHRQGVLDF